MVVDHCLMNEVSGAIDLSETIIVSSFTMNKAIPRTIDYRCNKKPNTLQYV